MRVRAAAVLIATLCFAQTKPGDWQSLFDGKSLAGWRETPFTRHGEVRVVDGAVVLGAGNPMTGITRTEAFPKSNYEVRLEAQKIEGSDFFASVTFPVGDSFCTWVNGGWGGDIVGLSSLDGEDASDNDTRTYFTFEPGRWYRLRLRVMDDRISAWIDERPVIDVEIGARTVGLRFGEIELSAPLGIASYRTKAAVRRIEYRVVK